MNTIWSTYVQSIDETLPWCIGLERSLSELSGKMKKSENMI